MTRAKITDLVLDGREVAFRLKAERTASRNLVHVDWVRFTVRVKSQPVPDVSELFGGIDAVNALLIRRTLAEMADPDFAISVQAQALGDEVCEALGPQFSVHPEVRKGHDFYRFRWSIVRNGTECGWVGYLASGDSPRQQAQASTMHVNLYGTACTFADHGFNHRLADLVRERQAVITRVDLALDYFDGITGGIDQVKADYMAGAMDVNGKRPSSNLVGDWCNGRARSFYFGSKEAGKQTNVYEKGHQLFGPKDDSPWVRAELRYGNKLRVLDADILNRPDDYFAGASDWHASALLAAQVAVPPNPARITTKKRLAGDTVEAEVSRCLRWLRNTAAASVAVAFQCLPNSQFVELLLNQKLPGRLNKFNLAEIQAAAEKAFQRSGSGFGRLGLQPYATV